jgi:hypothetical protein
MSTAALPHPLDAEHQPGRVPVGSTRAAPASSRKWVASALSIAILVAVVAPVFENWKATPADDFPLSYYPMFTFDKSDRQRVTYLVAYDPSGARFLLPYRYAGQGGLNQVRRQMNKLLEGGQASRLCRTVASRVVRFGDLPIDVSRIEIVTGTFLMTRFFAGDRVPVSENIRAACPVQRA